jgi:outer membrane protein assembly factor BamA
MTQESVTQDSDRAPFKCSQPATERDSLIREAEENQYTVRRIELLGNKHIRDNVLRRRLELIQEGEVFTRGQLIRSLKSVGRLRNIYPVKLRDVIINLDRSTKEVDMETCFKEKRR